ncbi:GAP family protein [Nocardioides pantholopis]|uniref:GAP family protein n=1 Tax=Nocardioides pantholopis TaxID=2483798 RepID=UPI0013DDA681|nr:GAP family protein [Nocardioides pantholopis]
MTGGALLGALGVLALVDSTSIGTLVLPLLMLLVPRVHVGSYVVYLLTIAAAYAVVGVLLVSGASWVTSWGAELGSWRWVRQIELGVGLTLFAVGVFGDPRRWFGRGGSGAGDGRERLERWHGRLQGAADERAASGRYRVVVGVALLAAGIEVASMVPFFAAAALITAAGLTPVEQVVVVVGYCLVMVAPAGVLLGLRLAFAGVLQRPLARLSTWMLDHSGGAVYWVLTIVGIILAADAGDALT